MLTGIYKLSSFFLSRTTRMSYIMNKETAHFILSQNHKKKVNATK